MREIRHNNINPYIGSCVEPNQIYIVTEYCSKGSLLVCAKQENILFSKMVFVLCRLISIVVCCFQDILANDDIKIDDLLIASLIWDLIKVWMGWVSCPRVCVQDSVDFDNPILRFCRE